MEPRFIGRKEIRRVLTFEACTPLMREAMLAVSSGGINQPPRQILPLVSGRGAFGIMPGVIGDDRFGAKLISAFSQPAGSHLPAHQGVVVLFDPVTGSPVCVLDAGEITRIRTAAASALATEVLARPDADRLAVLGTGEQAEAHIRAISAVRPLSRIVVWGRNREHAQRLATELGANDGFKIEVAADVRSAVAEADIVCTTTGSAEPILAGDWLTDGAHVNIVGSSRLGPTEVDDDLVVRARYFADSRANVLAQGTEFRRAVESGRIDDSHIAGEIGEVLAGKIEGRQSATQVTAYKSLGCVAQDLWAGWHVFRALL
ncbi:ornithine cyclodeaminase family protein [Phenylobacterium sp.]|uniref:ornithine cyclodeaminase family protein n=1 Tax=Phenylobacterium sp. TaxID=1871053 RepID=UPI0011F96643|nr:ornithine cyclodeaminase family protein [Phenylobacterium sp.]THD71696.1 MAG: ornithine cyclodeaminase family protein [Phenylobacterium sp.]